jgi:dTDP-4-dehydrorhamnose reductase
MPPLTVAIFGAGGLLGRALERACAAAGDRVHAFARADCDIARAAAVAPLLAAVRPDVVFNAAAATDVDRCEREAVYAFCANALGPRNLAIAALRLDPPARLVHVSTDYVFSGEKGSPYDELDEPHPLSVYGRSKREGERAVLAASPHHIVARTAWLYGPGGKSFVAKIPEILRANGEIAAVDDQWSSPTLAADAAGALRALAERAAGGLYHVANAGRASYFEVALAAAKALGIEPCRVRPQPSGALVRPAARPRATPLVSLALPAEGFAPLRPWEEAYVEYVRALVVSA